jgi:hypothetical protein
MARRRTAYLPPGSSLLHLTSVSSRDTPWNVCIIRPGVHAIPQAQMFAMPHRDAVLSLVRTP